MYTLSIKAGINFCFQINAKLRPNQLDDWLSESFGLSTMSFLNLTFREKVVNCVTCVFERSIVNLYKYLDGAVFYKSISFN